MVQAAGRARGGGGVILEAAEPGASSMEWDIDVPCVSPLTPPPSPRLPNASTRQLTLPSSGTTLRGGQVSPSSLVRRCLRSPSMPGGSASGGVSRLARVDARSANAAASGLYETPRERDGHLPRRRRWIGLPRGSMRCPRETFRWWSSAATVRRAFSTNATGIQGLEFQILERSVP